MKSPRRLYYFLPIYDRIFATADYDGRGVTIAFLDSGFYPHPDLHSRHSRVRAMIDVTKEKTTEDGFRQIRPSSWHGTMVACAAAGRGTWSRRYYRGVAPGADVVLIKVYDGKRIRNRNLERGLQWVLENHEPLSIRIVNISVGGETHEFKFGGRLGEMIRALKDRGIVVVVAAGNDPSATMMPPAACEDAITVGGFNDNNSTDPARYSEYGTTHGRTALGTIKPDVVAPAYMLPVPMLPNNEIFDEATALFELQSLSDKMLPIQLKKKLGKTKLSRKLLRRPVADIRKAIRHRMLEEKFFAPGHQHVDGTSFAAPVVSGVIAQMLQANPLLTPELVKMILQETAKPIPQIRPEKQGFGAVQATACVQRALKERDIAPGETSPLVLGDRIVFFLRSFGTRRAVIVGDFTAWQKNVLFMRPVDSELWRVDIPLLSSGDYRYKLLLDDTTWITDPLNPRIENDNYNGLNSVFTVGSPGP